MKRKLLLQKICFHNCVYDCVVYGSCDCDYCEVKLNELLDEYDKHVAREMYCKGVDDLCNEISTYRMYDEYGNVIDVLEIAKRLKAGDKE